MGFGIYLGGMLALVMMGVFLFEVEEGKELAVLTGLAILWPVVLLLAIVAGGITWLSRIPDWWYWHGTAPLVIWWDRCMERHLDKECNWDTEGSQRRQLRRFVRENKVTLPHINDVL